MLRQEIFRESPARITPQSGVMRVGRVAENFKFK